MWGLAILIGITSALAVMGMIAGMYIALARAPYGRETEEHGFQYTDSDGEPL